MKVLERLFGFLIVALMVSVLASCGGVFNNGGGAGRVEMTIQWPEPTRDVPPYAQSVSFELTRVNRPGTLGLLVVDRPAVLPATQRVKFDRVVPVGTYVLSGRAHLESGAQGGAVASFKRQITVVSGRVVNTPIAFQTSISRLEVRETTMQAGGTLELVGNAFDSEGNVLFVPREAFKWSIASGADVGTVSPEGVFTALTPGIARVRVREESAGVEGIGDIRVMFDAGGLGGGWVKFRGNIANTGQGRGAGAQGVKLWVFQSGGPITSSPCVLSDGTVFVGSQSGKLYAIHGATGQKIWEYQTGGAIVTSGLYNILGADEFGRPFERIYVGSSDGKIYGLNARTGVKEWEYQSGSPIVSSPTILGNDLVTASNEGGSLFSVDEATGERRWVFRDGGAISGAPARGAGGLLFVTSSTGNLYAIEEATGDSEWEFSTGGSTLTSIAVNSNQVLFFGSNNQKFYAVDASTGIKRWEYAVESGIRTAPAVSRDGRVIFGSDDGKLHALDHLSGQKLWEISVFSGQGFLSSPSLSSDGTIYLGPQDGILRAINGQTGVTLWQVDIGSNSTSSPVVGDDGTIYVGSDDGKLHAIR